MVNDATLSLITGAEGFVDHWYPDPALGWKLPTCCYGHTDAAGDPKFSATKAKTFTKAEGKEILRKDLGAVEAGVKRHVTAPLNENQLGALVSFVFNLGEGAFAGSTLLKKVNAKDWAGASKEFGKWTKAGRPKKVLPGLVKRRAAEASLFLAEPSTTAIAAKFAPVAPTPEKAQTPAGEPPAPSSVVEDHETTIAAEPKEPAMSNRPILDAIKAGAKAVLNREDVAVESADVPDVANDIMKEVAPRVQNATNSEPWYRSRVIVGLLGAIVGMIVRKAGGTWADGDVETWINGIAEIVTAAGALYALYGRTFASTKKPLGVK